MPVPKKKLKILYVCPFAHYTGHFSWAAVHEPQALAGNGVDVKLLTFCGVTDKAGVSVPQTVVRQHLTLGVPLYHLANLLRRWKGIGFISMFIEAFLTLKVAGRIKKREGYNIIHLRDGEPYLFLPHLFGAFQKNGRWLVSLTGSIFVTRPPTGAEIRKKPRLLFYSAYIRIINSRFWKSFYVNSLSRNRFLFITQNPIIKRMAEQYMDGVLSGKVISLELGADELGKVISKTEARKYFGLPRDVPVFLSFGFVHAGKDMETIFRSLKDIPEAVLLHGGDEGIGGAESKLANLAVKYEMKDRSVIRNSYIAEEDKPYYFFASDAIILSYTKEFLSTTSLLWQACRFDTPVIASDNGQLKELVEKYRPGLVFNAQDADSLAEAVKKFLKLKPGEVKKMQENCRRFAGEFSLKNWAKKCVEIYEKILAE